MTPDAELMHSIFIRYGTAIAATCEGSEISPAIVAALIANESGGDVTAKRFEGTVFVELWNVLRGRSARFGSIGAVDLAAYLSAGFVQLNAAEVSSMVDFPDAAAKLDALSTSWGLTQIMGYELFDHSVSLASIDKLATVTGSLQVTVLMAAAFVRRYALDLRQTGGEADLFRCWNTGRPGGKTFDKNYATNGISRAALYNGVLLAAGAAPGGAGTPA